MSPPPDLAPRSSGAAPALRPARRVGPWPTNTVLPPARPHPRPPIFSLPLLPPSFFGFPTPPPAPPARPQSCSQPFMLKPPNQHRDKSPASRTTTETRFVAIPPRNFAAIDYLTIEPKTQPGRKRGNQGNQGNRGQGRFSGSVCVERGETRKQGPRYRLRNRESGTKGTKKQGARFCRRNGECAARVNWDAEHRDHAVPPCLSAPEDFQTGGVHEFAPSVTSRRP